MIRVLIVDDSATARQALKMIFQTEPSIQVVGEATDGAMAVEMVPLLKPDVITMDINMPRMDGYDATCAIMAQYPTPIIVVSSVTQKELVHQGLDVLLAGALEIVQKPSTLNDKGFESVREQLIAKVLAMAQIKFQPSNSTPVDGEGVAQ
jgi:two-component system chemotaxis response regulator CheB